jgi:hypothetical protein
MIGGKGAKGTRPYPLPAPLPQSLRKAGEGGACGSSFPGLIWLERFAGVGAQRGR